MWENTDKRKLLDSFHSLFLWTTVKHIENFNLCNLTVTYAILKEAIWPTAIIEIIKFQPHLDCFFQINYFMNPLKATGITQFETDTFGVVCRILGKDFLN